MLTSARSDTGQRRYSDAAVRRGSLIRRLLDAGMSGRVSAAVLRCVDVPGDRVSSRGRSRTGRGCARPGTGGTVGLML
ncbi:MerR family transcriptional regulator [Amycolatopsis ultiminotia]|uniref:MerR family transcriptional regulator n=1 Tax=Amycolatopsis ultiminotia TaxID=543629 RepID=UPI003CD081A7